MDLLRGGAKVAVQPKVFQLLLVLLRLRTRALTRTELFDLVWADVKVGQDSLTRAIVQARRAIGDDRALTLAALRWSNLWSLGLLALMLSRSRMFND